MSTDAQRWEIWGSWCGGREHVIEVLETYDKRDERLADAIEAYGKNWRLWLEHFPEQHPFLAKRRHELGGSPKGPRKGSGLKLDKEEDRPEGWQDATFTEGLPPRPAEMALVETPSGL